MDTNTRQLAHLVTQTFEKFEAAVLTCLPPDKRAEVVLSAPWCEFRVALGKLTGQRTVPVCGGVLNYETIGGLRVHRVDAYRYWCPKCDDAGENDGTARTCTKGVKGVL